MSGYSQTYDQWRADPQAFWAEAAREISWTRPPQTIFDPDAGVYGHWFPDARCNACYNALDRHVEASRGDQPALFYDSPVTGTKRMLTYRELTDETATFLPAATAMPRWRVRVQSEPPKASIAPWRLSRVWRKNRPARKAEKAASEAPRAA